MLSSNLPLHGDDYICSWLQPELAFSSMNLGHRTCFGRHVTVLNDEL